MATCPVHAPPGEPANGENGAVHPRITPSTAPSTIEQRGPGACKRLDSRINTLKRPPAYSRTTNRQNTHSEWSCETTNTRAVPGYWDDKPPAASSVVSVGGPLREGRRWLRSQVCIGRRSLPAAGASPKSGDPPSSDRAASVARRAQARLTKFYWPGPILPLPHSSSGVRAGHRARVWHFFGTVDSRRKVASSRAVAGASSGAALPGFDLPQRTQQASARTAVARNDKTQVFGTSYRQWG